MSLSRYLHVLKKKKIPETVVESVQEPIDPTIKTSDDTEVAQTSATLSVPASASSDNVIVAHRVKVGLTPLARRTRFWH